MEDAIFPVIQRMADYSTEEAATAPSFTSSTEDLDHYDKVIIELTIKNLELPKNTPETRDSITNAYYRKYQTKVLKNMARTTSKNTKTIKNHGEFIIEQAHYNENQQALSAGRVLILKDLNKLKIDLKNKIKSKQIESARSETQKFLEQQDIKKDDISRIY